jgi:hypothetical protein
MSDSLPRTPSPFALVSFCVPPRIGLLFVTQSLFLSALIHPPLARASLARLRLCHCFFAIRERSLVFPSITQPPTAVFFRKFRMWIAHPCAQDSCSVEARVKMQWLVLKLPTILKSIDQR